nr:transposase [Caballeronia sordidicola]
MAACEPGVSVARLPRETGLSANLVYTWRLRYLAEQQAGAVRLVIVGLPPAVAGFEGTVAVSILTPRYKGEKPLCVICVVGSGTSACAVFLTRPLYRTLR